MNLNSIASLINLLNIKRVGPQKVRSLVSAHKNPAEVFSLSTHEICAVDGVDLKTAWAIRKAVHYDFGLAEVEKAQRLGVELITFWDDEYPFLLRKMYDPPVILYRKGQPLKKKRRLYCYGGKPNYNSLRQKSSSKP
jgi:DNA processing protein